jgi:MFS family permease
LKSAEADDTGAGPRAHSLDRSLWSPLRVPTFRNLLIADVLSDIGTFMQSVGAAWLMVSFGAGPLYVALTQTASSLPFFVLALPAGSVGDIADRRKLILFTEAWMVAMAALLAALTFAGAMTPWLLLGFTFAISAGDALETPTWRAILPELVPRADLPAASALNGIEFNVARAVGPALAALVGGRQLRRHGRIQLPLATPHGACGRHPLEPLADAGVGQGPPCRPRGRSCARDRRILR